MIEATKRTMNKYGLKDRVTLLEGPAQDSITALTGTFDIVFVDADKEGYEAYVKTVLDQKLLARDGVIICDNGNCSLRRSVHVETCVIE
jgi:predicted O-methyltransferase YrrM